MTNNYNRNSIGERVGRLEVGLKNVTDDVHALRRDIHEGLQALSQSIKEQKPQSGFYIGIASIIVVLFFGIGSAAYVPVWITTSNINAKAQAAQDAVNQEIPKLKAVNAQYMQQLKEIETQFRGNEQIRNIQFSEQQRMNNILMQVGQGAGQPGQPHIQYPHGPFYNPKMTPDNNDGDSSDN